VLTVTSGGQVMEGGSVSFTVTVKVQVAVPQELVAVQVTLVVPTGKVLPEAGVQLTVGVGSPVTMGSAQVTTALHSPESFPTVISPGQVIVGGVQIGSVTVRIPQPCLLESLGKSVLLTKIPY